MPFQTMAKGPRMPGSIRRRIMFKRSLLPQRKSSYSLNIPVESAPCNEQELSGSINIHKRSPHGKRQSDHHVHLHQADHRTPHCQAVDHIDANHITKQRHSTNHKAAETIIVENHVKPSNQSAVNTNQSAVNTSEDDIEKLSDVCEEPVDGLAHARRKLSELREQGIKGVDSKLLEELTEDNIDEHLITEEIEKLSEEYDLRAINWKQRMVHFLHTIPVEIFLMSLVLIDVVIILAMVVIDINIIQANLKLTNNKGAEILSFYRGHCGELNDTLANATSLDDTYDIIMHWSQVHHGDNLSPTVNISTHEISHNRHKRNSEGGELNRHDYGDEETYSYAHQMQVFEQVNHAMHYLSVAILAVFVIEIILKLIGYGKSFFKAKWEVMDAIVIIVSFALDISIAETDLSGELGKTILIVFLMWRMIRILNAMVLTSRARTMFRLRVLRKSKKIAEERVRELTIQSSDHEAEIKKLRSIARRYGAEEHELQAAVVLSKTSVSSTQKGLKSMMAQLVTLNTKIVNVSASCNNLSVRRPSCDNDSPKQRPRSETFATIGPYHKPTRAPENSLQIEPKRRKFGADQNHNVSTSSLAKERHTVSNEHLNHQAKHKPEHKTWYRRHDKSPSHNSSPTRHNKDIEVIATNGSSRQRHKRTKKRSSKHIDDNIIYYDGFDSYEIGEEDQSLNCSTGSNLRLINRETSLSNVTCTMKRGHQNIVLPKISVTNAD